MQVRCFIKRAAFGVGVLAAWVGSAAAMTFTAHPSKNTETVNAILGSGPIEADDGFRLQTYISKMPKRPTTELYLDSSGGLIRPAMDVGRIVNESKIRTLVLGDAKVRCSSACTLIFMAGRDLATDKPYRVKGSANNVGWHNFYPSRLDETKKYKVADMLRTEANAQKTIMDKAKYFREVDADLELISLSLKQETIYNMSNQEALRFGIHVFDATSNELVRSEPVVERLRAARKN